MNRIIKNIIMSLIIVIFIITSLITLKTVIDNSKERRSLELDSNTYERNIIINENSEKNNNLLFYVLFSLQVLIVSLILIYLIMSNLNIKSIKETFGNNNLVLFIASVLLLFSSVTLIGTFTTDKIVHDYKYDIKVIEV
ncbi:MAG: hypothetical protein IJ568_05015 [Bacilli bacterium]|nr:hypothetical protein [Bacilli bacterium]